MLIGKRKPISAAVFSSVPRPRAIRIRNQDQCSYCGEGGDLLCCDNCPASFHLACSEPPLSAIPEGEWHCRKCRGRLKKQAAIASSSTETLERSKRKWSAVLSEKTDLMNPKPFELPANFMEEPLFRLSLSHNLTSYDEVKAPAYIAPLQVCNVCKFASICQVCTPQGKNLQTQWTCPCHDPSGPRQKVYC